eukprot:329412-Ditylum_brightwellii.AAC.1
MTCYQVKGGSTDKASMYTGGCIFVDNASGLVHIGHQSIRFSGARAAYQNGIDKRNIKTICDTAQVLMIHVGIYNGERTISEELWTRAKGHGPCCLAI